jgi:hypothetical protein
MVSAPNVEMDAPYEVLTNLLRFALQFLSDKQKAVQDGRVRREDGSRHEVAHIDPTLVADLQHLVEPVTMGDQERPLKWVSKNPVKLADKLSNDELSNMAAICTYPTIEPIGGLRFGTARPARTLSRAPHCRCRTAPIRRAP